MIRMSGTPRIAGRPASSNGASSFHAGWELPAGPLAAVSAVIEVNERPAGPALYFWALQVSFRAGAGRRGAGHLGLQHHPAYPGSGAVNWGGYHDASRGGGVLDGSASALPSTLGNPNTFDYSWQARRRYRLEIAPAGSGRWRGSITDLESDVTTVVRELFVEADHLSAPIVWSEVFADCDAPPVEVRWSSLGADSGCSNTSTTIDDGWLVQRTATPRSHAASSRLEW